MPLITVVFLIRWTSIVTNLYQQIQDVNHINNLVAITMLIEVKFYRYMLLLYIKPIDYEKLMLASIPFSDLYRKFYLIIWIRAWNQLYGLKRYILCSSIKHHKCHFIDVYIMEEVISIMIFSLKSISWKNEPYSIDDWVYNIWIHRS